MFCFLFILICDDIFFFFFFSSRRRHTRLTCDWSSDVCSSDLREVLVSVVGYRHDHQDFSRQHHDLSASARGGPVDTCAFPDGQRSPVSTIAKKRGICDRPGSVGGCRERMNRGRPSPPTALAAREASAHFLSRDFSPTSNPPT